MSQQQTNHKSYRLQQQPRPGFFQQSPQALATSLIGRTIAASPPRVSGQGVPRQVPDINSDRY